MCTLLTRSDNWCVSVCAWTCSFLASIKGIVEEHVIESGGIV